MKIREVIVIILFIAFCVVFWDMRKLSDNIKELFKKQDERIQRNIDKIKRKAIEEAFRED